MNRSGHQSRRGFLLTSTAVGIAAATGGCHVRGAEDQKKNVLLHDDDRTDAPQLMQGFPPPKERRVTIPNYREDQAHRRWSHMHMRELFPTQLLWRGDGPVSELPRKTRSDLNDIVVPDGLGAKMPLGQLLRKTHTDAFLVLHRGAIINEQYFFGMRPETPHNLWSVSKSLSVGVVACLMEDKTIQEDDPITKYIKEWGDTAYRDATVRDLLDMQSGVLYNYEPPEMPTWVAHTRYNGTRLKLPDQPLDEGEYDFLTSHPEFKQKVREHGEAFYYKESDARGLLWASERATGQRFSDLFSSMIWSKLGAERDAYVCCDGLGSPSTNGRINCTLRDLARWGQMHLNGGRFNGNQILPQDFINDIPSNADPAKITEDSFPGPRHKNKTLTAYRSQYWIPKDGRGDFTAAGYNGQWCYISPRSQTVIVKFSTYDDDGKGAPRFGDMDLAAFQHLITVLAKS